MQLRVMSDNRRQAAACKYNNSNQQLESVVSMHAWVRHQLMNNLLTKLNNNVLIKQAVKYKLTELHQSVKYYNKKIK